jgi:PAS domain S-box-containing protein
MSDGRAADPPHAGDEAPPPLRSSLSTGAVFVRVSPVRDASETAELSAALRRIHGVTSVDASGTDGESALFRLGLGRPVAMGSDLRATFGRRLRSFTRVTDGFEVVLDTPPAAGPWGGPAPQPSGPSGEPVDRRLFAELAAAFEASFSRSPAGQALVSPAGRWLRVNDALARLLGRDADGLVGTDVRDLGRPDDGDAEAGLHTAVARGRQQRYTVQRQVVRADGSRVRIRAEMTAIRDDEGELRGFIAHVVDADAWGA